MKVAEWFHRNRFKASSFSLNEERTIGNIVSNLKNEFMKEYRLLDEIIVVDSGSKDDTLKVAKEAGAAVYLASKIMKRRGDYPGKGENLWKSLFLKATHEIQLDE